MKERNKRIFIVCSDIWKAYETSLSKGISIWHEDAEISDEGMRIIKCLYETQLAEVNFQMYGSSPFKRAVQAAETLSGGNHVFKWKELGPISVKAWNEWHRINRKIFPASSNELLYDAASSALLYAEGDHMFHFIKSIADRINLGQNALLVSHQILAECALAYVNGSWPLKKVHSDYYGMIFHFGEGKEFIKCEFISHNKQT